MQKKIGNLCPKEEVLTRLGILNSDINVKI